MKTLLSVLLMGLLSSSSSFAATACAAHYTAGLGHLFKGMTLELGDKAKILENETAQDELYTVKVQNGVPSLTETQSGKAVTLYGQEAAPGLSLYSTQALQLFPTGVPGAFDGRQFIMVLCADEKEF